MTIGGSIALIVLGAILAFAVEFSLAGLNINMIGFILMLGGLIGLALGLVWWQRGTTARSTVVHRTAPVARPAARSRVVEEEYREVI